MSVYNRVCQAMTRLEDVGPGLGSLRTGDHIRCSKHEYIVVHVEDSRKRLVARNLKTDDYTTLTNEWDLQVHVPVVVAFEYLCVGGLFSLPFDLDRSGFVFYKKTEDTYVDTKGAVYYIKDSGPFVNPVIITYDEELSNGTF